MNPEPAIVPPFRVLLPARKCLIVAMGAMLVSDDVSAELATHALGSCVGMAIYDPVAKVGGLLHVLLPDSALNRERAARHPFMFADTGLPATFRAVYALGGVKSRLQVKLAGGAAFHTDNSVFNIGNRNVAAVLTLLAKNGVKLEASATGGQASRTIRLNLATGAVTVATPGKQSVWL